MMIKLKINYSLAREHFITQQYLVIKLLNKIIYCGLKNIMYAGKLGF